MSMTISWTLGELLAKIRKDADLEQTDLARRVGIARNTISNYETGRSVPPFDVAARIARECGVSLDWLASMCAPSDSNREPIDYEADAAFWAIVGDLEAVTL